MIGAGLLGSALATRLLAAGFRILGYDIDPGARDRLLKLRADLAAGPEMVASACRRIFLSLPAPADVLRTVELLEHNLQPGSVILDSTTGDPDMVESIASRLASRDVRWLDSEIGGSSRQTAAGEAIVICGGPREAFDQCMPLLSAISARVFYTGPAGTGTRMKLALNIAIGLHRAVLAESLEFARANGINPELALEILKAGPAYSRAMEVKGRRMLTGDFEPEARLAQHLKDVRLILKTGAATGARLPLSAQHEQLLAKAVELGLGGQDNSAIIRVFSGTTV